VVDDQATGEQGDPRSAAAAAAAARSAGSPVAMTVAEAPACGDVAVDDAVARLVDLPLLPLDEHPAVYEGVHRTLTDRLADVEG